MEKLDKWIELENDYLTDQPLIWIGKGRGKKQIPDPEHPPTLAYMIINECTRGRCQIMPSTAKWLAKKFRWDSPVDLDLREHSEALAHQRLKICRKSLQRRFGRAPSRSLSWCYLSGRLSLRTPRKGDNGKYGDYGKYLDLIARKMDMVRQNQRNWMAWEIIPKRSEG